MERIALVMQDPHLQGRIEEVALAVGADLVVFRSPETLELEESPIAIVVELELKGAIDAVAAWKARWPSCFIVGSVALPRNDVWHAAVAAGCGLVSNRGALPRQLRRAFEEHAAGGKGLPGGSQRLRVRLNDRIGDGLVGNLPDAPIAVFRIGERLCALRDVCPHAGVSLADGTLEGNVLTCPEHGSQFDGCTGERLRGPSDYPLRTYRVVREGNEVFVEV